MMNLLIGFVCGVLVHMFWAQILAWYKTRAGSPPNSPPTDFII